MSGSMPSGVSWICGLSSRRALVFRAQSAAAGCKVHDTERHRWRHLNFFQHEAYLTARVQRVRCPEHGVRQVHVPSARERSDFTPLFEAFVKALVKEMPVAPLAALVGEDDMRIWRIVHHYVDEAVGAQDLSEAERLGIDDTSFRRGQDCVSVFCDLDPGERRAVFVTCQAVKHNQVGLVLVD